MKTSITTWKKFVTQKGNWEARQALKWVTRPQKIDAALDQMKKERDELSVVHELVHVWPDGTPSVNRLKFAEIIRILIQRSREHRQRIMGYCVPGVPRRRLP